MPAPPAPIPFPSRTDKPKGPEKPSKWLPFIPEMRPWTSKEAESRREDISEMWKTYGEYADMWLQKQTANPDLEIWDFTEKEMKAILKWCLRRGQTNGVVAFALDRALEGRTDVDFAVILGTKALQTGYELSKAARLRRKKQS